MRDGAFTAGEPSEREGTASRTRASRRIGKFSFLLMTHERTKRSTGLPGPGPGPGPGRGLRPRRRTGHRPRRELPRERGVALPDALHRDVPDVGRPRVVREPQRELLLRQGSRDPVRPFDEQRALGSHEVAEAGAVQVVLV